MLQLLEQRCKDKFFSHKQRGLARTDVAAHFKSLALTACSIAVKDTILSRHTECTDAGSVHRLIEDNLDEARDAWKEQAKTQLQQFLNTQFSLLLWDVIGARPPTTIAPPPHILTCRPIVACKSADPPLECPQVGKGRRRGCSRRCSSPSCSMSRVWLPCRRTPPCA